MEKKKRRNRIFRFFKFIYIKLFRVHDTPQRIALGMSLGVFSGILPGTGPIAAVFLALVLHANRAAALLGSLLTNTWLSIFIFLLSIRVGSTIIGLDWQDTYKNWISFLKDFKLLNLFQLSTLKTILPIIVGYLTLAIILGLLAYLIALFIVTKIRHEPRYKLL